MKQDELNAFYLRATLPNYVQEHMASARWLLADEPARRQILAQMAAYVTVEAALQRQGHVVRFRTVEAVGDYRRDDVNMYARQYAQICGITPARIRIEEGRITIQPDLCRHCSDVPENHVDDQCLFMSTKFESRYVIPPAVAEEFREPQESQETPTTRAHQKATTSMASSTHDAGRTWSR